MDTPILRQFDQVEIITTKHVSYLSARPGEAPSPHGVWSVVGIVDSKALIAKDGALIHVPLNDLRKVSSYDLEQIFSMLRGIGNGRLRKEIQGQAEETV